MTNIWILITLLLDTVPFTFFVYNPLKKDLKYSSKAAFPLWLFVAAAVPCLFFALTYLPFYTHDLLKFLRLGVAILLFLSVILTVKGQKFKAIFIFSLIIPFSIGFSVLSAFISQFINGNNPPFMVSSIVRAVIILALYPLLVHLWKLIGNEADRIKDPTIWKYLWLIPTSAAVSEIFLMDKNFELEGISFTATLGRIVLWIGSIAVCWLIFFLAHRYEMRIHLQDINERNEMLLELQEQQYAALAESVESARAARHDLRHHLTALKAMVEDKDYERLEAHLNDVLGNMPHFRGITVCENYTANAILEHYIRKANEQEIPIKVSFGLSRASGIDDTDLCVLLANCLENALEASLKLPAEDRFIIANALEEKDRIYMTFDNGFNGAIRKRENRFLSSKRDFTQSGIGISSVKTVVKKYGGDVKIETDNNVFKVSILIMKKAL